MSLIVDGFDDCQINKINFSLEILIFGKFFYFEVFKVCIFSSANSYFLCLTNSRFFFFEMIWSLFDSFLDGC